MSNTIRSNKPAERSQAVLQRLDSEGISSPEQRRKGKGFIIGALAAVSMGVVAHEPIADTLTNIDNKIISNFDYVNLPPGGQLGPADGVDQLNNPPSIGRGTTLLPHEDRQP